MKDYHLDTTTVEIGLDHFNDTLMVHFWRVQKSRIKQSNLDSFFKKVDKRPPTDEPPTGQSPKMSRNDGSSPVLFLNLVYHPLVPKNSFTGPVLVLWAFASHFSNNCLAFSQIIASLTLSPTICFSLIHTNRRVSISFMILQCELLNLWDSLRDLCTFISSLFLQLYYSLIWPYHIQHLDLLHFFHFLTWKLFLS